MTHAGDVRDGTVPLVVTVVIPARDAAATLQLQLEALDRQEGDVRFGVIVVDNGSTDGTGAMAAAHRSSRYSLQVVQEPAAGVNHARNAGIAAAPEGLVLLCDADDEVSPQWVAQMAAAAAPGIWLAGVVDYAALNSRRTRLQWGAGVRSSCITPEPFVDRTFGGNCGFHRSTWESSGRFDDSLSGTGDETEFFERAYAAGFRQRWVPDAVIAYRLRPGLRNMCRQRYRQGRNLVRMMSRSADEASLAVDRRATVRALVKLMVVSPTYLFTSSRRYSWLGSFCRHVGRLAGHRAVVTA